MLAGKDVDGIPDALEPVASQIVTQAESSRALPAAALAEVASTGFGPDHVVVRSPLPDPIAAATRIAADRPTRTAVLVTGSVVTAGQARSVLVGEIRAGARVPVRRQRALTAGAAPAADKKGFTASRGA
ncbi:hypothetical protein ACFQH9_12045 [Pseudonocardia lutea]|uniref:Uncharacterized protein n=1 Tax=Pseudonocardia lutea TaxID=2172015 RepID=A0ABW1I5U5_9PSEU